MSPTVKRRARGSISHVLIILTIVILSGGIVASSASANRAQHSRKPFVGTSQTADVRARLDKMMAPDALDSGASTMGGLSSNPYDYVKDNPEYREIVALGYDALPALEAALNDSEEDGLREYMICIAIEEITNCDLKQFGDSRWQDTVGFRSQWPAYLERIPDRTRDILSSNMNPDDKTKAIRQLGAPAVPYVADNAGLLSDAESAALAPTIGELLEGGRGGASVREVARLNAARIRELRAYVEGP